MSLQAQYYLHWLRSLPRLPLIMRQAKYVRQHVPRLPEAEKNRQAKIGEGPAAIQLAILGESAAAGVGITDHRKGISGRIAERLHKYSGQTISWQVIAKNGFTLNMAEKWLLPEMRNSRPDLILLAFGGNNTFKLHSPARWKMEMRSLLTKIREAYTCPVLISNLPPVGQFPAFPEAMRHFLGHITSLLSKASVEIPPSFTRVYFMDHPIRFEEWMNRVPYSSDIEDFFSDGVHPSALTHELWGKEIADYIIQNRIIPLA